ncbi:dihydrofolate reductase [Bisporella sp. PMI_857]|nr:dihydrofolate reductase [Bisporella sp. PMI_857]
MAARELTLIVAATNKMGIGRLGSLPWTGLKKEMAYFARVTKRAPDGVVNSVIMGRKTWESIPTRFRPLKDRFNLVVTSKPDSCDAPSMAVDIGSAIKAVAGTILTRKNFIIGGGQLYQAALEQKEAKRILLTRVLDDFECDIFFPIVLGQDGKASGGWTRRNHAELSAWVGEDVPEGIQEENGTKYIFEMWERDESNNA